LAGERLEQYLRLLDTLLEAGRLNRFFPDPAEVRNVYRFLSPANNEANYPTALIDLRSGLPAETEVSRVLTDAEVARDAVKRNTLEALEAEVQSTGSDAARRRLSRFRYQQALARAPLPSPFGLSLALRRVDPDNRTAHFTVTFDRFDMGDGVFVRYTILLAQTDSRWTRPQVELVGDDLKYTENFRNAISRFTVDEAEFAFLLLSDLRGVRVEDVIRCRVGPLYFRGMQLPGPWEPLFETNKGGMVMHFPSERAGRTVAQDGSNDPMGMLYREFLSPQAREGVEPRVRELGYKVWKERKFACTREVADALRTFLADRGFKCLIQPV
jgi:hypothetical protein